MASVWGELKRRNVVRVAVAYAIVGWILVEVTSTVLPIFEAPDWIVQVFTFFIILGFPIALILSWAYELTPEGIKLERNVAAGKSITKVTGRQLDFVIIGVLVIAVALFTVDRFVLNTAGPFAGGDIDPASLDVELDEPPSATAARTPAIAEEEQREVLPNSVAVLPFENLSPDPDNAYYAAGIHEEILNQLAKLSALNVIARTSMRQYANTEKSIQEIARELNVETVMEGSVRYSGGRIRITAQLNDGITGAHLWSETYTLDFDDIFEIESDVAMNVANAVGAEFSLAEQESIEKIPTESLEAYTLYLRALSTRISEVEPIVQYLDEAIALDSEFALAFATKAFWLAYAFTGFGYDPAARIAQERILRDSADRALALDANLGLAHAALGGLHQANWRGAEAEQSFERAYRLSPNDADVLMLYGRFKRYRGEYDAAIQILQRAVDLDPINSGHLQQLALAYRRARMFDEAVSVALRAVEISPTEAPFRINLAFGEVARGNNAEAVRELQIVEQLQPNTYRLSQISLIYTLAGRGDDAARVFSEFERRADDNDPHWVRAYIAVGDYQQALQRLEYAVNNLALSDVSTTTEIAVNTWNIPELNAPEFQELLSGLWDRE